MDRDTWIININGDVYTVDGERLEWALKTAAEKYLEGNEFEDAMAIVVTKAVAL